MYYQNYEDYMRSVLGYPMESSNTYDSYNLSAMPYESQSYDSFNSREQADLMELYPDIYKLVNPMVCKICDANTNPITRELVDQMTEEIYLNIESTPEINTIVNVKVNAERDSSNTREQTDKTSLNRTSKSTVSSNRNDLKTLSVQENREKGPQENREDRQRRPRNRTLQDLIRILILNQLLGIHRPPRPPHRPRPPFPRPPFYRENMYSNNYLNF